jgi:hypothetical protein
MSKFFEKIKRDVKNVFVGSHKGEDVSDEWFQKPHPHDSMPVANGSNRYAPPEKLAELEKEVENNIPKPEETTPSWFNTDQEDGQDYEGFEEVEEEKTMHQKMYEIATARYNPFSLGGSENCDSDLDCNIGGSEEVHK